MRISKVFSFSLFFPLFILLMGSCNAKDNEEIILKEKYDKNALISNNEYLYSYANILDKATPAVVSVYTSMYVKSYQNQMHPYMDLFRQFGFPIPDSYDNSTSPNESNE